MTQASDRIEKQTLLATPLDRVWDAIGNSSAFGTWFGAEFDGPFEAGERLTGRISPTAVDTEVAKAQAPYSGSTFEIEVDRIEPKRLFSFLWHPYAIDPHIDYSLEPMTLVTFTLEAVPEGTRLTVTETGFEQLNAARRATALQKNDQGWAAQMVLIGKYLATHA
jgi:uncharacterized protein YndB with AHSA1/START domain